MPLPKIKRVEKPFSAAKKRWTTNKCGNLKRKMGKRTHNKTWCLLICIAVKSTWNLTNEAKKREKGCGMDGEVFIPLDLWL